MTHPAAVSVGDQATAAFANALISAAPGLVLATVNTAVAVTSTGATEILHPNLALSVTVVAGQNYFVEYGWKWVTSVAADTGMGLIHAAQAAITVASPVITQVQHYIPAAGANMDEHTYRYLWTPGASGSWNLQAGCKRFAGTGNTQIASGQQNAFLTVVQA